MNFGPMFYLDQQHKSIEARAYRVVEAQHISSSRDLVESIDEHDLLEELLEEVKPKISTSKHYLIFTPFRYPPLKYGSRFGKQYETSLWYGSMDLNTALSEVAYYRLKFFADTSANLGFSEIPMTVFNAYIKSMHGLDLTEDPFSEHQDKISDKTSYEYSQALGSEMRKSGIKTFIFDSARSAPPGKNIAAFTPEVFIQRDNQYISNMQNWQCLTHKNSIEFTRVKISSKKRFSFYPADFE